MKHALAFTLSLLATGAIGQEAVQEPVGLELVLLADASGSIDAEELAFQRSGYAQAMQEPRVLEAIAEGLWSRIAVTYVEWAEYPEVVVPWMVIEDAADAAAFAEALAVAPRRAVGRNAIGRALLGGMELIEGNDIQGVRGVIDFSGDTIGNFHGPSIAEARREVLAAGITINGLPILRPDRGGDMLADAYADRIIGGPDAFMVVAESRETFALAVRRKLVLEIAGLTPDEFDTATLAE
ncbi:DUF1194 domain-containing protein [Roseobacter sp. HKCCA0434]|uniref:DUF1194 domain-containing protein n=1 Tax=Roseobacter sp. HKCCA0434 TaxID=3079297 RepID=UPI002905E22C|nr:DUF1194 domain-containing protein [Roseobacter sp. HKCCA0434]